MQQINTQIRVGAIFESGRAIRPVWFDWQRQKYTVTEITYRWQELSGIPNTPFFRQRRKRSVRTDLRHRPAELESDRN